MLASWWYLGTALNGLMVLDIFIFPCYTMV
jgi:hypothetical protein